MTALPNIRGSEEKVIEFPQREPAATPRISPAFAVVAAAVLFYAATLGMFTVLAKSTLEREKVLAWRDGVHCGAQAVREGADGVDIERAALQIRSLEEDKLEAQEKLERGFK